MGAQNGGLLMRRLTGLAFAGLLLMATAGPSSAKDFGTIYFDGQAYRTFGNPASVPAGTGTDPIVAFTNFDQGGVTAVGPGAGAHGGRWQVWLGTWADPADAHLLTSYDEVLAEVNAGNLTLERAPDADFRCPILPGVAGGTT
jgi:hypothetical protein